MQYTLRNVPKIIDHALRRKAKAERTSLNQAALDALKAGLGVNEPQAEKRDLSFMGHMDDETLKAIQEVRECSERVWPDEDR